VRDGTVELRVEPMKEVEDLLHLRDGLAEVAELVGVGLHLGAVLHHRHLALDDYVVLSIDVDHAGQHVVTEEVLECHLNREGGVLQLHDHIEELRGDRGVQPVDDAIVDHVPLAVAMARCGVGVDVGVQTKLADDGVKEAPPLCVVGHSEVKDDRDVATDGHRLGWWRGEPSPRQSAPSPMERVARC
jgi:hypothetical protein